MFICVCRYHNGDAYIIDVSQSVEHDHPHALEFLRKDCSNVNGEPPPPHEFLLFNCFRRQVFRQSLQTQVFRLLTAQSLELDTQQNTFDVSRHVSLVQFITIYRTHAEQINRIVKETGPFMTVNPELFLLGSCIHIFPQIKKVGE